MDAGQPPVTPPDEKATDSIPRATIRQLLETLAVVADGAPATFERVRKQLQSRSVRMSPGSDDAMWTVARDALSDLARLGFAKSGALPRKRSEVDRLRDSPCEATDAGHQIARLYNESRGRAFDVLLLAWMNEHRYFRTFQARLSRGPLFIPDISNARQIGSDVSTPLGVRVNRSCVERLKTVGTPAQVIEVFEREAQERAETFASRINPADLDAKKMMDAVENAIVLPALLTAEGLPFDPVTLQHLIRVSQDFVCAAWTSAYPSFDGRVVFATSDFEPSAASREPIASVSHHGKSLVMARFTDVLASAYERNARGQTEYVDAYALRALVCAELQIQPTVFGKCLEDLVQAGGSAQLKIYTELPFDPPPPGETYVELFNQRRIGLIKLVQKQER